MPTTNLDSSILTKRRRAIALFTFFNSTNAAVAAGTSIRREQPDAQLSEVVADRHETKGNTNPPVTVGDCGCTAPVQSNAGGDSAVRS